MASAVRSSIDCSLSRGATASYHLPPRGSPALRSATERAFSVSTMSSIESRRSASCSGETTFRRIRYPSSRNLSRSTFIPYSHRFGAAIQSALMQSRFERDPSSSGAGQEVLDGFQHSLRRQRGISGVRCARDLLHERSEAVRIDHAAVQEAPRVLDVSCEPPNHL